MNKHLNEKNEQTEKVIHLAVTTLCDRDCKCCCNKWYSWNEIPQVTKEELSKAEVVCITGGEPFAYSNPCYIAKKLKHEFPNIKKVYVYTNAIELCNYLLDSHPFRMKYCMDYVDGLNISVKSELDVLALKNIETTYLYNYCNLPDNRIYVFNHLIKDSKWPIIHREWQKDFIPANDSIFRRI